MKSAVTKTSRPTKRIGTNVPKKAPKISVVIPAYNAAEFIGAAIDSVLAQKYTEYEIIVVNDGSPDTDRFERAIRTRREEIIYIKQANAGAGVARNTAIEHARGELIAFLDGDDVWLPDFLVSQFVFMQSGGYDMVYCDAYLFGLNSAYRRTFMETAPSEGEANFESILDMQCSVITSGTMAERRSQPVETERYVHDFTCETKRSKDRLSTQRLPPASASDSRLISRAER
jgi:glycosyltransferase involved in cell wall biosynthesis